MQYLFVLGKNPSLSLAEIRAKFNRPLITILSQNTVLLKLDKTIINPQHTLNQLGGTIKIAKLITDTVNQEISANIENIIKEKFSNYRDIGFSYYNFQFNLNKILIDLKKILRQAGHNKRFIFENNKNELNAATIKKNKLISKGSELVIVSSGKKLYFAQTVAHQDADAYTLRDYGKPKPDSRSGMLPPKLAQIMINLSQPKPNTTIYDPFCGSGIVLQEAIFMKLKFVGSDISKKAIVQTRENLKWLIKKFNLEVHDYRALIQKNIFIADATYYKLSEPVDCIVTEPYLGPAHHQIPSEDFAKQIIENLTLLYQKFLQNTNHNLKKNGKLVFVTPVIKTNTRKISLELSTLLDEELSKAYNMIEFNNSELIYEQPNQKVLRRIIILEKK